MRLTPENKKKITERIRAGAARVFRAHGYHQVNLDKLMKESKLTRGTFYAHYRSKAALFADVVEHEHPRRRMLQRRTSDTPEGLHAEMLAIFENYLRPEHLEEVFAGCSLAALAGDAARASDVVRAGFEAGFQGACQEMARGQGRAPEAYVAALVLAAGALRTARAMADETARAFNSNSRK